MFDDQWPHFPVSAEQWWRFPETPDEQRLKALEADLAEAREEAARMRRERDLEIAARVSIERRVLLLDEGRIW